MTSRIIETTPGYDIFPDFSSLCSIANFINRTICQCLSRDVEYCPGVVMRLTLPNKDPNIFHPFNKNASKVEIILEDGKRFMDRCLFENLYLISKNPAPHLFSDTEAYVLPFTTSQFDSFISGVFKPESLLKSPEVFASYYKITNFLMPKNDDLYAVNFTPYNFIDSLDISLDLFPAEIVRCIMGRTNILKHSKHPEVVKQVILHPEVYLPRLSGAERELFSDQCGETAVELGLDYREFAKAVNRISIERSRSACLKNY